MATRYELDQQELADRMIPYLKTAEMYKDAAAFFYDMFPMPHVIHGVSDTWSYREVVFQVYALAKALRQLCVRGGVLTRYADRTFSIVWRDLVGVDEEWFVAQRPEQIFLNACFALVTVAKAWAPLLDSGGAQLTKKDHLLGYFLWIVHGRTDEECPFPLLGGDGSVGVGVGVGGGGTATTTCETHDLSFRYQWLPPYRGVKGDTACGYCETPGARQQCAGCVVHNGRHTAFATFYCNKDCQVRDARRHKALCHEVRALRRACRMYKVIYHMFLCICDDTHPRELSHDGPIAMARYDTVATRCFVGDVLFRPFPMYIAKNESECLMIALNSHLREATTTAQLLLEVLVRPAAPYIEEIIIQPKNMYRSEVDIQGMERRWSAFNLHHPLRITLKCGLQFAFDPTALRFGWADFFAPWDVYVEQRAHNGVFSAAVKEPLKITKEEAYAVAADRTVPSRKWPLDKSRRHIRRCLLEFLAMNMPVVISDLMNIKDEDLAMSTLLNLPSNELFEERWLEIFKRTGDLAASSISLKASDRMFLDHELRSRLTDSAELRMKLEKVWFSWQGYQGLMKSTRRLHRTYLQRYRKKIKNINEII